MNFNKIEINCSVCNKLITTNEKNDSVTCECGAFWYLELNCPDFLSAEWEYWARTIKCAYKGEHFDVIYRRFNNIEPKQKFVIWLMYKQINTEPFFFGDGKKKLPIPRYLSAGELDHRANLDLRRWNCLICGYEPADKSSLHTVLCKKCNEYVCPSQTYYLDELNCIFVCHSSCGLISHIKRTQYKDSSPYEDLPKNIILLEENNE